MLALLGNWKLIAAGAAVIAIFLAGWNINGTRWESKWNKAILDRQEAVDELRAEMRAEFEAQRDVDDVARRQLAVNLTTLRAQNQRLETELDDAQLTKTPDEVRIVWRDRVIREEVDGACEAPVLANPFTSDFARLFNDSAAGGARLSGADPAS